MIKQNLQHFNASRPASGCILTRHTTSEKEAASKATESRQDIKMDLIKAIQMEVLKEAFKNADEEGTGKLTFSQIKNLLMLPLVTEEQKEGVDFDQLADVLCKMADVNGDKMIDYEELVKFIYDVEDPKEKNRVAFHLCDTNGDGLVCKNELGGFLKLAGVAETGKELDKTVGTMITLFDWDDDGKLNYEEFCDLMEM